MRTCTTFLVALLWLWPFSASALLDSLPLGSARKIADYKVPRTTELWFDFRLLKEDGRTDRILADPPAYNRYLKPDGSVENISAVAQRSEDELAGLIQTMMRAIVAAGLDPSRNGGVTNLENRRVVLWYSGISDYITSMGKEEWVSVFGTWNTFTVAKDSSGNFFAPEEAYTVDFPTAAIDRITVGFFVPGIIKAQLIYEDIEGNILAVLDGNGGYNPEGISVYPERDLVAIPTELVLGKWSGTLRIWYRDGKEQLFELLQGEQLITYLSPLVEKPFRRLGVPRLLPEGLLLSLEALYDENVFLEQSKDLRSWVFFSYLAQGAVPLSKTSVGSRPRVLKLAVPVGTNGCGFFRAIVASEPP